MVNFLAVVCVQQNIDASDKNHYLYRDTLGTREWRFLPWDLDLTFGPNALNTDTMVYNEQDITIPRATSHPFIGARPYLLSGGKYNRFIEAIVNVPRTRAMLLRRIPHVG
jgi:spore coat protein CotH